MVIIKSSKFTHSAIVAVCLIACALGLLAILVNNKTVKLNPETTPVYTGPGISYHRLSLTDQKRVLVIGEQNQWYKIRLSDHKTAWTPSWLINSPKKLAKQNHLTGATIVIDPGHGGSDSGAEYKDNSKKARYMERTYTLQIAHRLARRLRKAGANVILTRTSDKDVGLKERVLIGEHHQADCFVSLHLNSSPDKDEGTGVTTYYYHRGPSKQLARSVSHQFSNLPLKNLGIDFGDFLVVRDNKKPAILCETGYVNTKKDFKHIRQPAFQNQVADDIKSGLNNYLK